MKKRTKHKLIIIISIFALLILAINFLFSLRTRPVLNMSISINNEAYSKGYYFLLDKNGMLYTAITPYGILKIKTKWEMFREAEVFIKRNLTSEEMESILALADNMEKSKPEFEYMFTLGGWNFNLAYNNTLYESSYNDIENEEVLTLIDKIIELSLISIE